MPAPFTVTFGRPASPSYPEAVRLAKQAHSYVESPESGAVTHHATFGATPEQLGLLVDDAIADLPLLHECLELAVRGVRGARGENNMVCTTAIAIMAITK